LAWVPNRLSPLPLSVLLKLDMLGRPATAKPLHSQRSG
jgi:hypothetical protein